MSTCVFVDGPYPNANARSDWDEFPEWTVCLMDDDGVEQDPIYYCLAYGEAVHTGECLSKAKNLELVIEAEPCFR